MIFKRYTAMLGLLLIGLGMPLLLPASPTIQTWQTTNGAKVLFVPAPEIPMLDVRVVFDAGSARDGNQPGVASFTNNLLNQGAGAWSAQQIAERLESVGAKLELGSLRDMAWVSLRTLTEPEAMHKALETMAAVMAEPRFDQEDVERERQSIQASLLQDEQAPDEVGQKALYHKVFGQHPYAEDPKGTQESVAAIQRKDLIATHKRLYVARNAIVAIVGAVDRAQAETIAESITKGLAAGEHAPPLPAVQPLAEATEANLEFPSTQAHIYVGQPGIKRDDPDYFPLYVGNHVLGGSGLVSILSEEVREKRGLSYSVYSYFIPMREEGVFMLGLQTKNSQAGEALQVLNESLRRYVEAGPTDAQLKAAKQNITGGFPLRIASNSKIVEYLAVIGFYDLPLDYLATFTAKVEAVSAAQIRDAFQRRIHPERMVTVLLGRLNQ